MKQLVKRKNFYLDEIKIKKVQKILSAKTETETVNMALDMVLFRKELINSLNHTKGKGKIDKVF